MNQTGTYNIAIGGNAGFAATSSYNIFIGHDAGSITNAGMNNVMLGNYAGNSNISGNSNIFIGNSSGQNSNASNNVFIGTNAGLDNVSGVNNVFLGFQAGISTTGSGNVILGYWAGPEGEINNKLYINNESGNLPLIYGDFGLGLVGIKNKLGVAVNNPLNTLDVKGNMVIGSSYAGVTSAAINGLLVEGKVGIGRIPAVDKVEVDGNINIRRNAITITMIAGEPISVGEVVYIPVSGTDFKVMKNITTNLRVLGVAVSSATAADQEINIAIAGAVQVKIANTTTPGHWAIRSDLIDGSAMSTNTDGKGVFGIFIEGGGNPGDLKWMVFKTGEGY